MQFECSSHANLPTLPTLPFPPPFPLRHSQQSSKSPGYPTSAERDVRDRQKNEYAPAEIYRYKIKSNQRISRLKDPSLSNLSDFPQNYGIFSIPPRHMFNISTLQSYVSHIPPGATHHNPSISTIPLLYTFVFSVVYTADMISRPRS